MTIAMTSRFVSIVFVVVTVFLICRLDGFRTSFARQPLKQSHFLLHSSTPTVDVNALPDSKRKLIEITEKVNSNLAKDVMNVGQLRESVRDMEQESSQPGFWDEQEKAQTLLSELNRVKATVQRAENWLQSVEDVGVLLDMAVEDPESANEYLQEVVSSIASLEKDLDAFEVERLLGGKYDRLGVTLCIQSGAGGTEAMDWAGMYFLLCLLTLFIDVLLCLLTLFMTYHALSMHPPQTSSWWYL